MLGENFSQRLAATHLSLKLGVLNAFSKSANTSVKSGKIKPCPTAQMMPSHVNSTSKGVAKANSFRKGTRLAALFVFGAALGAGATADAPAEPGAAGFATAVAIIAGDAGRRNAELCL